MFLLTTHIYLQFKFSLLQWEYLNLISYSKSTFKTTSPFSLIPYFSQIAQWKVTFSFFSQTPFSKCTTNISFRCHYPQVTSTPVINFMQNAGSTSLVSDVTEFIPTEFPLTLYSISGKMPQKLSMASHKHKCLQLIYTHMYATCF